MFFIFLFLFSIYNDLKLIFKNYLGPWWIISEISSITRGRKECANFSGWNNRCGARKSKTKIQD